VTDPGPADPPEELARQAQHECGHAAASWALGIPFLRITLHGPRGAMVEPVPGGTHLLVGQHWLIQACGAIAEWQREGQRIRGSQIAKLLLGGGDDDLFELDGPAAGEVTRISRTPAIGPGCDLEQMATTFAAQGAPPAYCIAQWRDWERFAESCRPAIDALAKELLARGELPYDEACQIAAAAMEGKPPPVIPAQAARAH
jgi:hypothetical protein